MRAGSEVWATHVIPPSGEPRGYNLAELAEVDMSGGVIISFPTYAANGNGLTKPAAEHLDRFTGLPVVCVNPRMPLTDHHRYIHTGRLARHVAEAVPKDTPVHLLGHSMGGSLALQTMYFMTELKKSVGHVVSCASPTNKERAMHTLILDLIREGNKDRKESGSRSPIDLAHILKYGYQSAVHTDPLLLKARCLRKSLDLNLIDRVMERVVSDPGSHRDFFLDMIVAEDDLVAPRRLTAANFENVLGKYQSKVHYRRQELESGRVVETWTAESLPMSLHAISGTTHVIPQQMGCEWNTFIAGLISPLGQGLQFDAIMNPTVSS